MVISEALLIVGLLFAYLLGAISGFIFGPFIVHSIFVKGNPKAEQLSKELGKTLSEKDEERV